MLQLATESAPMNAAANTGETKFGIISDAIAYMTENWRDQPGLDDIADHVGMDAIRFQKHFTKWCGLSPKGFIQAITLDHARELLRDRATVLDATYEVGLSGPGRLHDLFVSHEAMTPGEYRSRGAGLEIAWGFHDSPFGEALVMATERGLAGLAFADGPEQRAEVLDDMMRRWPAAEFVERPVQTSAYASRVFDPETWTGDQPLRVVFIGTDFEIRVWETLLRIPMGRATTYGDIANHLGKPSAARAVGSAVGRNPISFVVPCHRVLGKSGGLCGYHWGLTRKKAIIGWEAGMVQAA